MNHNLRQAHNLIRESLINDVDYRSQWFMQLGKAVAEGVVKEFPDLEYKDFQKLTDNITENILKEVFAIELSAEKVREIMSNLRKN